jgi:outer membrane phospholipase A
MYTNQSSSDFEKKIKVCLILLFLLPTGVMVARAQSALTSVFVSPPEPLVAGGGGNLWLYCMNNSSQALGQVFEPTLPGALISGLQSVPVVLTLSAQPSTNEVMIAAGGFFKAEYFLNVPATIRGSATLQISNYNDLVVTVVGQATMTNLPAAPPAKSSAAAPAQVGEKLMSFLGTHLSPYEPIYFLLGSYPAAEFQLSLKYKIFAFTNDVNPLANLYFAYTQTSFWDLISQDPSFYDTSYKPSAFLYYPELLPADSAVQLDLQGGFEHESNGRGGLAERSLYTVYFQPALKYQLTSELSVALQPRFWDYLGLGDNNPDLANYRGYGDLQGSVSYDKIQFATKLGLGKDGNHAGWQFELRFNLPRCFNFNPAIQVEYFTGYGQTLRQYNQYSDGIRAGLCLWY